MSKRKIGDQSKKALFLQRFLAFLIDMMLVSLIASIIYTPFMNRERLEKIEKQELELIEQAKSADFDSDVYIEQYASIYYKSARESGLLSLITISISLFYFVVYQIMKNGQTIGKRLLHIRVISEIGELTVNQMIFRSFLANYILLSLLNFIFMLFLKNNIYFYVSGLFSLIQLIIVVISAFMIMNRKDGLAIHDKLVHTVVIRE